MKKYNIKVNGVVYEVEVEEVSSSQTSVKKSNSAPSETVAQTAVPVKKSGSGEAVKAPMPGKILKINVKESDAVKNGDVLMILEAMKMENEIKASKDGVVTAVSVSESDTVNTGDALLYID